jgi:hypothetical protein
MMGLME